MRQAELHRHGNRWRREASGSDRMMPVLGWPIRCRMFALAVFLPMVGWAAEPDRAADTALFRWPGDDLPNEAALQQTAIGPLQALEFSASAKQPLDLGFGESDSLRVTGALSLRAVVRLATRPTEKQAWISKWDLTAAERSYELGIDGSLRPYFSISATGRFDEGAAELTSSHSLELGVPYAIAASFQPGQSLRLYINGHLAGELTTNLPDSIHDNETRVWLAGRAPNSCYADVQLAEIAIFNQDLPPVAIRRWSAKHQLTSPPQPTPPTFLTSLLASQPEHVSIRPITRGPRFHWFGYYDKHQFDPTERYVLGMEVAFEHRSPTPEDMIKVGMVDLQDNDRWIELDETRAWCWQQGCMLQWRPRSGNEILWNDRQQGELVCHILNVQSGQKRTLSRPVYHVSPDGKWGLGLDFIRLDEMDRGYGYRGEPDPNRDVLAPDDSTIYRVNLETGECQDLISVFDIARIPYDRPELGDKHYFNHIQWSPDGQRFLFLNRWNRQRGGRETRMFTAAADGTDLRLVNIGSSHFEWRDPDSILIWVRDAYRLFRDNGAAEPGEVIWNAPNGHQSYLPGKEWLITDTYPLGPRKEQHVYLHHVATARNVLLAALHSPPPYRGEWRCDTHPRISRSGTKAVVDSPHEGQGRQMYLLEFSDIVDTNE